MATTPTKRTKDVQSQTPRISGGRIRKPSLKALENILSKELGNIEMKYQDACSSQKKSESSPAKKYFTRNSLCRNNRDCKLPQRTAVETDEAETEKNLSDGNFNNSDYCKIKSKSKLSENKRDEEYLFNDVHLSPCQDPMPHNTVAVITDDSAAEDELYCSSVPRVSILEEPLQGDFEITGRTMFGFNTPKKRSAMTPIKTPKVQRSQIKSSKQKRAKPSITSNTPSRVRRRLKNTIAKFVEAAGSGTDFSADDTSDYAPSESEISTNSDESSHDNSTADDGADEDELKTAQKCRHPILVPVLPKTPSVARMRQRVRAKKTSDYVPESDGYFQAHSSTKILTSDHTLDRLKNPRLPSDRIISLLSEMRISSEHEYAINAMLEEYRSYFPKWLYILNEGFNILLYGLGSKRQLMLLFQREVLAHRTVLVVNGFFPSLTIKNVLDSIIDDILDAGSSPTNQHEAVDLIEEEFALIPATHLYLIVHNLDGVMLRNAKAQGILARLANIHNIHLIASIDHINTPLLWDHNKLSQYKFSWWDCSTMLSYSDETAYENSLLVQNSGELALASMRSVFSSLTSNTRGIYLVIVRYQLRNKSNPNYQGMPFKDLYWRCRESFLVSSDLALRAQLTEFLDHKLVKSKRSIDGAEQLSIPIESALLQQFLDEHEKK